MSEVILLKRNLTLPGWPEPREDFRTFVDAAFRTRRKTLRNSLSVSGYDKAQIEKAIEDANLSASVRAEQLNAHQLAQLFHHFPGDSHAPIRMRR
jgi:16S rRNA (adenine1518-N6/adenine1519-N6)-dimethyltransferase